LFVLFFEVSKSNSIWRLLLCRNKNILPIKEKLIINS